MLKINILSIDIGTSSTKTAVLDENFRVIAGNTVGYSLLRNSGGFAELDAEVVLKAVIDGVRGLEAYADSIELIVYDTFSPSMAFMNEDGHAVYPIITHLDRRSAKQTQDILTKIGGAAFLASAGIQPFTGGASVTSLLWMLENEPEIVAKSRFIGHLSTFIYKQLTGEWAIDPVNASMTGMYRTIDRKGWAIDICRDLDIPVRLLPEIRQPGSVTSGLCEEFARLCGLKTDIPVALGTNDAASAQVGAGNEKTGDILNISGSSEMVTILTDLPKPDERYYLRASCTPGLWQIYATTAGGFALDWCRNQFFRDLSEAEFFSGELTEAVKLCGEQLTVKAEPYLAGDRQSLEIKRASITGLTLSATRREILAAILTAMNEPILKVLSICEQNFPLNSIIKLTGGMVCPELTMLKEGIFTGYRFEPLTDCPLIGNAILGMRGLNKA